MANTEHHCPYCGESLPPAPVLDVPIAAAAPPSPAPPTATAPPPHNAKTDLRALAQRQRWVLWVFLAGIVVNLLTLPGPITPVQSSFGPVGVILIGVVGLGIVMALVVLVVLLLVAQGTTHWILIVLCGILMLCPCVNLLVLLFINSSVTRTLKKAGIRVGLLGARAADVERAVNPAICKRCGYDLTGNVSGVCPECGEACPSPRGFPTAHRPPSRA
jgi:hypothetical protein